MDDNNIFDDENLDVDKNDNGESDGASYEYEPPQTEFVDDDESGKFKSADEDISEQVLNAEPYVAPPQNSAPNAYPQYQVNQPQNNQPNTYNPQSQYQYNQNPNNPQSQYQYSQRPNNQQYVPPQNNQQTQWTFNDYGPIGMGGAKPPKPPKNKKDKKPHGPNFGIKVFAIVISVLFVVSLVSFGGYVVWEQSGNGSLFGNESSDSGNENSSKPSMNFGNTPDTNADKNGDGTLSTKEINEKVSPSVVGIAVYTKTAGVQLEGQGSGIIMSKDGYIVTNYHVVTSNDPTTPIAKIEVILNNGETYDAKLIGGDMKTDLAVVKIMAENLTPAEFGDSDKLCVGDRVIVIGNPSGIEYAGSLTQGVVSALNRKVYMSSLDAEMQYIQTDAAINPGNSGGAFINEYGQVVGISSAKVVQEGFEGMGFAIPINNAKDVVDSLIKSGYVTGRPKIGIQYKAFSKTFAELNGMPAGLRVVVVEPSSDAYKKGVLKGDLITKMDGKEVYDSTTIATALEKKKPGDKMVLTIYRVDENGKSSTIDITVTLGEQAPSK